jgi:hypothetical protein
MVLEKIVHIVPARASEVFYPFEVLAASANLA